MPLQNSEHRKILLLLFLLLAAATNRFLLLGHVPFDKYKSIMLIRRTLQPDVKHVTGTEDSVAFFQQRNIVETEPFALQPLVSKLQSRRSTKNSTAIQPNRHPQVIQPRAYPSKFSLNTFPCNLEPPNVEWWKVGKESSSPIEEGFFFLKTHKTGSSTGAGIHLRIARNVAQQRLLSGNHTIIRSNNTTEKQHHVPMCISRFDHGTAQNMNYGSRNRNKSFLWTILRDPTERAISQFFHFEVSRRSIEPTDENFRDFLLSKRARTNRYYLRMLSLTNETTTSPTQKNQTKYTRVHRQVQEILDGYDFIAITERMDESAVALQLLLGLSTSDILYLDAKSSTPTDKSTGFDAGGYKGKCTRLQPKIITKGMRQFLRESPEWRARVEWDKQLYRAANQSLDMTINALGKQKFQQELERFRHTRAIAQHQCVPITKFPCSEARNGKSPLRHNQTDCLWKDSGCGSDCLDGIAESITFGDKKLGATETAAK